MKSLMNDITLESVLQVEGIVAKRPEDQVRKVSKSIFFLLLHRKAGKNFITFT